VAYLAEVLQLAAEVSLAVPTQVRTGTVPVPVHINKRIMLEADIELRTVQKREICMKLTLHYVPYINKRIMQADFALRALTRELCLKFILPKRRMFLRCHFMCLLD
jgi:hypothetical protein